MLEYYSYPKRTIEAKVKEIDTSKKYVVKRVEFPSALNVFGSDNVRFDYYVQRKKARFPTVLVLPISGGVDFTVKSFANCFASNGFNCAIVRNRKVDLDDAESAEQVEDYFRQSVLDSRQVLDYLVQRQEVDANRLGCVGLSLGGIKTSMIVGVDERLKCCVMGLAGGSIADITLLSEEKKIKDYIRGLIDMGIGPETIHTELSKKIKTDPLKLAKHIDARNALMFIAMFDRVVPKKCGDRLWKAIGKPEVVYLLSGHYTSILYLPCAQMKCLKFFQEKFDVS
ncbi:hypothetical protein AMJ85_00065 [candidate division BRC1 bacterium SM23_51]|nr:MAG: hypothetical protein AMJ85_00065 [candidate division BRC1 bacterium SM23_51]